MLNIAFRAVRLITRKSSDNCQIRKRFPFVFVIEIFGLRPASKDQDNFLCRILSWEELNKTSKSCNSSSWANHYHRWRNSCLMLWVRKFHCTFSEPNRNRFRFFRNLRCHPWRTYTKLFSFKLSLILCHSHCNMNFIRMRVLAGTNAKFSWFLSSS